MHVSLDFPSSTALPALLWWFAAQFILNRCLNHIPSCLAYSTLMSTHSPSGMAPAKLVFMNMLLFSSFATLFAYIGMRCRKYFNSRTRLGVKGRTWRSFLFGRPNKGIELLPTHTDSNGRNSLTRPLFFPSTPTAGGPAFFDSTPSRFGGHLRARSVDSVTRFSAEGSRRPSVISSPRNNQALVELDDFLPSLPPALHPDWSNTQTNHSLVDASVDSPSTNPIAVHPSLPVPTTARSLGTPFQSFHAVTNAPIDLLPQSFIPLAWPVDEQLNPQVEVADSKPHFFPPVNDEPLDGCDPWGQGEDEELAPLPGGTQGTQEELDSMVLDLGAAAEMGPSSGTIEAPEEDQSSSSDTPGSLEVPTLDIETAAAVSSVDAMPALEHSEQLQKTEPAELNSPPLSSELSEMFLESSADTHLDESSSLLLDGSELMSEDVAGPESLSSDGEDVVMTSPASPDALSTPLLDATEPDDDLSSLEDFDVMDEDPDFMALPILSAEDTYREELHYASGDDEDEDITVLSPRAAPTKPDWSVRATAAQRLGLSVAESAHSAASQHDEEWSVPGSFTSPGLSDSRTLSFEDPSEAELPVDEEEKEEKEKERIPVPSIIDAAKRSRSAIDFALAMQLRPGMGSNVEAAWMVRFLMTSFSWLAVVVARSLSE